MNDEKNKKILFLTNMYPSNNYPSYGIFVKKTYEWLSEKYNVKLIKIFKEENYIYKIYSYITFYMKAIIWGILFDYDCIYAHYISHCAFPIRCIKKLKKNIIIVGNIHGEDVFSEYEEYKKNRIKSQKFIEKCDYIIAPSEFFKDKLCEEYPITKEKVYVSPSGGINTKAFCSLDKIKCREKMGLDVNKKYIGYVSRIEKGKGWDIFINALCPILSTYDHINAIIVGEGKEEELLHQRVKELGISNRIIYFLAVDHESLPYLYNAMNIFCFPSRRMAESLGLVGLEAMSCEIPSVITKIHGPSTYAKDGYNCLLFDPEDEIELRKKIEILLNISENDLKGLKENSRLTAIKYDTCEVQKNFLYFWERVLEKNEN